MRVIFGLRVAKAGYFVNIQNVNEAVFLMFEFIFPFHLCQVVHGTSTNLGSSMRLFVLFILIFLLILLILLILPYVVDNSITEDSQFIMLVIVIVIVIFSQPTPKHTNQLPQSGLRA